MVKKSILLVLVGLVMSPALHSLADAADPDLVAWWKLDDGTGTVAADSSDNGHDGTFEGDPEWVAGKFGGALYFDGLGGERIGLGTLDIQAEALTIAFWLKADNLDTPGNDPRMISKADGGANDDHWWMVSSSRIGSDKYLRLRLKTTDGQQTSELKAGSLDVDEWIHAAAWWDGATMRIYKNGEEAGRLDKGGDAVAMDSSVNAAIGNQPLGAENRPFEGILDDVRIYSKALTEDEIAAVMEGKDAQFPLATGPNPKDGTMIGATWTKLEWASGSWAVTHDLYMGTNFDDVNDGAEGTLVASAGINFQIVGFPGLPFPEGLEPGTTYYWRVDEVNPTHSESPWKGVVWSFYVSPQTAYQPVPPDTMKFVDTGTDLRWTPGWGSAMFHVYFGTDPDVVANATEGDTHVGETFDPGPLEEDTTYYWRVDSFDGTQWHTGDVWSFTTTKPGGGLRGEYAQYGGGVPEPPESAMQNVVLTRIDPGINFQWGSGSPEEGVVTADNFAIRWTGELDVPLTGRYTFWATTDDGVLLWVNGQEIATAWRTQAAVEQSGQIDLVAGEFASIEMLYFTTTGNATAELRWQHESIPKDIIPAAALSPPVRASSPRPPDQSVNVPQDAELTWSVGDTAKQHDVYFGEDRDAVATADTTTTGVYQGRQDDVGFPPGTLEWSKTYYWRIDEVNDASPQSPWIGPVWSFTTANFLVVDDMESYTDEEGSRIYETWIDGWTNNTGSLVGYLEAPFAEQTIVNGGQQSMPVEYNNVSSPFYSEVEREFASAQDWTINAVTDLVVWFRGDPIGFAETAPGAFTMSASGTDIWGTADEFRFAHKRLNGDGSITVKVDSVANTNSWAKAGVMIRESLDPSSRFAYVVATPAQGVSFGWRMFQNDICGSETQAGVSTPQWVRLTRTGNDFTAQYSENGNTWTDVKDGDGAKVTTTISMMGTVYVGLAVTSHNAAAVTTAEFSGVQMTGGVTGLWQATEVGVDHPGNSPDDLYVAIEDSAGKVAVVVNPDPAAVTTTTWTEWSIPLSDFAGVNAARINKMYIGVGDRANPSPNGAGRLYIDDIRVLKSIAP